MARPDDNDVLVSGNLKAFGEFLAADARACAEDLARGDPGWVDRERAGLPQPTIPEMTAWRELADELDRAGVTYVRELPESTRSDYARRVGVDP
jgi:hypothetical protein